METEKETTDSIIFTQVGGAQSESLKKSVDWHTDYVMRVLTGFTTNAL